MRQITFDKVFKTILLISIGYFLFIMTEIANQLRANSDVGRFQLIDRHHVIDTKTGAISNR
jgi:hypothetical protein